MMPMVPPALPTVGAIAERFGVKVHVVEYLIRRWSLTPIGRAGAAFVYSDIDVDFIGSQIQRARAERGEAGDE